MTPGGVPVGSERAAVLVIDAAGDERSVLSGRARRLGFRVVRAKTPEEAVRALQDPRRPVAACVLPPDLPVVDLRAALADYRARAQGPLGWVVAGLRPRPEGLRRLEEAGVELALWDPFPDAALRYQLNLALDDEPHVQERERVRVPLARKARILGRTHVRTAPLYTLSTGGAFIETARPAPRRAEISLELVLPDCDVGLRARVLYTNVPGNLRNERLPLGMGIGFEDISAGVERAIEQCVSATALSLCVGDPRQARQRQNRGWLRRFVGGA